MKSTDLNLGNVGRRVTFPAITGTIIDVQPEESAMLLEGDDGVKYGIAIEGPAGHKVIMQPANPKNWPPVGGDAWAANSSVFDDVWTFDWVNCDLIQGYRFVRRTDAAMYIRTKEDFLEDHPNATLQSRRK